MFVRSGRAVAERVPCRLGGRHGRQDGRRFRRRHRPYATIANGKVDIEGGVVEVAAPGALV